MSGFGSDDRSIATKGQGDGPQWRGWLRATADGHTRALDSWSPRHLAWGIALASGVGLFLELAAIRWHAACFHAFGHFKNVSLLSCFLGLGIGYALGRSKRIWTPLVLPGLGLQILVLEALSRVVPDVALPAGLGQKLGLSAYQGQLLGEAISCGLLLLVFVGNAFVFIPLGQLASRLMSRTEKVRGYGWNLFGSVLGVGLFALCSRLWLPPAMWFGLGAIAVLPFLAASRRSLLLAGPGLAAVLLGFSLPDPIPQKRYFSPYQMVTVAPQSSGITTVHVGHAYHQRILDLSGDGSTLGNREMRSMLAQAGEYYDSLYELVGPRSSVLVVGSGTGNDVAAALRHGAEHVDAVEIDPTILWLGRTLHPERPYDSPKVRSILSDARTYLRNTDRQYDLIVYGLLDSHTMVGSRSNVRLDSFVYTVEAFRESRRRLTDDGLLAMSFCLRTEARGSKFYRMIESAFDGGPDGTRPRVLEHHYDNAKTFIVGPGMKKLDFSGTANEVTDRYADSACKTSLSTDDWPFVYLNVRSYPVRYLVVVGAIAVLSLVMIRKTIGFDRGGTGSVFFFLGAGFMLIETKSITDLGLVFGNTWVTVAVVITAIMGMAFLANLWVLRRGQVRPRIAFACLGIALLVGHLALRASQGDMLPSPKLILPLAVTLPLFFSGLVFSGELSRRGEIGSVMAANLFGAMCGGVLEYNALYWGLGSLTWLGLGLYGLAFLSSELAPGALTHRIVRLLVRPALSTPRSAT